ncbi:MAG: hypothetical protein AAF449_18810, partial [Myxococcota bacterium]
GLSDSARQAGLRPNMTQSEAKAHLSTLQVRPRNVAKEVERLHAVAELLLGFGALVEVGPPNMLWVEIGRGQRELARRLGDSSEEAVGRAILQMLKKFGHRATVAIASDPSTARTFSLHLAHRRWAPSSPGRSPFMRRRQRVRGESSPRSRNPKGTRKSKAGLELTVVEHNKTASRLAGLPISALLWTDKQDDPDGRQRACLQDIAGSLKLLGVTDVARLASLPSAQISSRFGEAGALLVRRAKGEDERPLRPFIPPDHLAESFEFDAATEDLEPILFVLRRLFSRIEARLEARGLATTDARVHFIVEPKDAMSTPAEQSLSALDSRTLKFKKGSRRQVSLQLSMARPTRKAQTLLAVAREQLNGALPGGVWGVEVEAHAPTRDSGAQLDLFNSFSRKVEDIGALVSRLQAALGVQAVFSPHLEDTHRPEAAWSISPFSIEQALAEPSVVKPAKAPAPDLAVPALKKESRTLYALPEVDDALSVTGTEPDSSLRTLDDLVKSERPWPKPVPRKQTDEPLPPLPPRPMALFEKPEPVSVLESTGFDEGVLVWRGRRHHLVALTGSEHLAAEWWTSRPIDRDYVVAEVADGRRFWLFFDPRGEAFMHGVFD